MYGCASVSLVFATAIKNTCGKSRERERTFEVYVLGGKKEKGNVKEMLASG